MTDGICPNCQKPCQPILCTTRPKSSEFYCKTCHMSYPMDSSVYALMIHEVKQRPQEQPS